MVVLICLIYFCWEPLRAISLVWLVSALAPALGPLMGEPLKLWGPLLIITVQSWQQFLQSCAHRWLVPPLGPALGPLMVGPLWLWEPLPTSRVSLGSSFSDHEPTTGWFLHWAQPWGP